VLLTGGAPPVKVHPTRITQRSIDGATLGHRPAYYTHLLGGFRPQTLSPLHLHHFPSMAFQTPKVAVYFPSERKTAFAVTTWNPNFRTNLGIGPCSTLAALNKAYGHRVAPTWAGTVGGQHWSWAVGKDLLFVTEDPPKSHPRTIADVVLFRGSAHEDHQDSPQSWANFIGSVESRCG
jgi:hypothetical protein